MIASNSPSRKWRLLTSLRKQGGFTIIHALVAGILSGVAMTGTWMAYRDFTMQARISNADRQMDQYAAAAMQDLTNMISWSWGGQQIVGGLYPVWKFQMADPQKEFGHYTKYDGRSDQLGFVTVSFNPSTGLLIGRQMPSWARDRGRDLYVWRGRVAQRGKLSSFDRRDGMTMTGLQISFPTVPDPANMFLYHHSFVDITIRMQYRYSAPYAVTMYSNQYVHERTFSTRIFMRNWDVEHNSYRDDQVQVNNVHPGGA